jgi:hypothetical protein
MHVGVAYHTPDTKSEKQFPPEVIQIDLQHITCSVAVVGRLEGEGADRRRSGWWAQFSYCELRPSFAGQFWHCYTHNLNRRRGLVGMGVGGKKGRRSK